MPTPKSGESRKDFVSRCVPIVKKDKPDLTQKQVLGECYGIYDNAKKSFHEAVTVYYGLLDGTIDQSDTRASWSTAYINDLPDSSFLYIEPGGKKVDGKTEPRKLRHLPYKDENGKVDLPHLRNAISRLGQSGTGKGWLSEELRKKLLSKAEGILKKNKKSIRAITLSDRQARVMDAFFGMGNMWSHWPVAVYEDSLVTKTDDGRYHKFAYNWNDGEPTFDEAVEVEQDFRGAPLAGSPQRGTPIRLIESEGDTEVFECCMVRFTDEDEKDAYATFFDSRTDFHLDWFEHRPWLYEHTRHSKVGLARMGMWTDADLRDEGLFVRGELDRSNEFWKDFRTLIDYEVLYPSSGTLSYAMSVAEDGHVEDWPFIEGSSTVTPADIGAEAVQPVLRAYRSLEENMSEERKGFLARLFSNRNDVEQPPEEDQETPAASQEEQEPEAPPSDDEVRAAVIAVDATVKENREGILTIDTALRAVVTRLDAVEAALAALTKTEGEKVQESMRSGSFLAGLWSATRGTGAPETPQPPAPAQDEANLDEASGSPAVVIAARSRRAT